MLTEYTRRVCGTWFCRGGKNISPVCPFQPRGLNWCLWCLHRLKKQWEATSPNQSIGRRQEAGIVLHFFSLFLPGIFLPLTGGAASMPTVERGAPFLSAEIPPSLLCSGILFIPGAFLTLNSPCILSQPQTGRDAPKKKRKSVIVSAAKKSTRSGSDVRESLAAARLQRESLVSVCVQYTVTIITSGQD